MKTVKDLLEILILEEVSKNQFNGVSKTVGSPNVFGGQVLAQALNAAYRTILNQRVLHSMHAYFLEAGKLNTTINYEVSIIRDGGSFSTRRVTAKQEDKIIFILAASFHKQEEGYEHQIKMRANVKPPEELISWDNMIAQFGEFLPSKMKKFLQMERPIEFKPTIIYNPNDKKDLPPFLEIWFKLKGDASTLDLATKQQILTYISDYNILSSALQPHASKAHYGNTQMASLDHSMWFFRDFDFTDWMLFSIESPSTSNARGFTKGNIFSRNGKLIASVAQEGLMRPLK
ncbi:MAG: acyl-CoA thioesterase II [Bacteroidetes bacterium]|nr:MAG: acyl-CoA thioesterase II [Bacteroidota bacterium]